MRPEEFSKILEAIRGGTRYPEAGLGRLIVGSQALDLRSVEQLTEEQLDQLMKAVKEKGRIRDIYFNENLEQGVSLSWLNKLKKNVEENSVLTTINAENIRVNTRTTMQQDNLVNREEEQLKRVIPSEELKIILPEEPGLNAQQKRELSLKRMAALTEKYHLENKETASRIESRKGLIFRFFNGIANLFGMGVNVKKEDDNDRQKINANINRIEALKRVLKLDQEGKDQSELMSPNEVILSIKDKIRKNQAEQSQRASLQTEKKEFAKKASQTLETQVKKQEQVQEKKQAVASQPKEKTESPLVQTKAETPQTVQAVQTTRVEPLKQAATFKESKLPPAPPPSKTKKEVSRIESTDYIKEFAAERHEELIKKYRIEPRDTVESLKGKREIFINQNKSEINQVKAKIEKLRKETPNYHQKKAQLDALKIESDKKQIEYKKASFFGSARTKISDQLEVMRKSMLSLEKEIGLIEKNEGVIEDRNEILDSLLAREKGIERDFQLLISEKSKAEEQSKSSLESLAKKDSPQFDVVREEKSGIDALLEGYPSRSRRRQRQETESPESTLSDRLSSATSATEELKSSATEELKNKAVEETQQESPSTFWHFPGETKESVDKMEKQLASKRKLKDSEEKEKPTNEEVDKRPRR